MEKKFYMPSSYENSCMEKLPGENLQEKLKAFCQVWRKCFKETNEYAVARHFEITCEQATVIYLYLINIGVNLPDFAARQQETVKRKIAETLANPPKFKPFYSASRPIPGDKEKRDSRNSHLQKRSGREVLNRIKIDELNDIAAEYEE